MAYLKAEYSNDFDSVDDYYDRVEVCDEAARSHPKSAIQIRNRNMVDRSDLVVCYVNRQSGGAFQTMEYAKKIGKTVINLADNELWANKPRSLLLLGNDEIKRQVLGIFTEEIYKSLRNA